MIVFDLDSTLRNNGVDEQHTPFTHGTDHTVNENWRHWQLFVNATGKPIRKTVRLYNQFVYSDTVILTSSQFGTSDWLSKNGIELPDLIRERKSGDTKQGLDYKKPFIDKYRNDIILWVDDHTETCDYVESLGIPVVRVTK